MNRTQFHITAASLLVLLPDAALADLGHAAERAGHSHWIGLAALAAAAIALALLRKQPAQPGGKPEKTGKAGEPSRGNGE